MQRAVSVYLDAARTAAALLVFIGHTSTMTGHLFGKLGTHGSEAVAVFFVLSGFVIAFVTATREPSWQDFARARALRIYSVAILACLVTLIADAVALRIAPDVYGILDHAPDPNPLAILSNVISAVSFTGELWGRHSFIGSNESYWSIGFEVWYYVLFGVLLFLRGPIRLLAAVGVATVIGPTMTLYFSVWWIGVLCFRIVSVPAMMPRRSMRYRMAGIGFLVTGPLLFVVLKAAVPLTATMYQGVSLDTAGFCNWLYFNGTGLAFGLSIVGCHMLSPCMAGVLRWMDKPVRWVAGGTFTLYIMHEPVLLCFAAVFHGMEDRVKAPLMIACTLAVIAALAELGERRKHLWAQAWSMVWRRLAVKLEA